MFGSLWFDGGLVLLGIGGLLLLWALGLYLARRRSEAAAEGGSGSPEDRTTAEAIRGYYAERDRLFKFWERQERSRRKR